MKRVILAIAVIALCFSVISCRKCIHCQYQYVELNDTIKESKEFCGKSKENKDFKFSMEAESKLYHAHESFTCEDIK
jgi:hypothetical protein